MLTLVAAVDRRGAGGVTVPMAQIGKMILLLGVVLVVIGAALWGLGKAGFRGLPGDIRYESERGHVRFYFPIVTCLVLSALATLALWLWQWFNRR